MKGKEFFRTAVATGMMAAALTGCKVGQKFVDGETYQTSKNTNCLSCPMDEDPNRLQSAYGCSTQINSGTVHEDSSVTAKEGEMGVTRNGYVRVEVPDVISWNPVTSTTYTSETPQICWVPANALEPVGEK